MTCIVAIPQRGRVFMAADSLASGENDCTIIRSPKLHAIGRAVVGIAGEFAAVQVTLGVLRKDKRLTAASIRSGAVIERARPLIRERLMKEPEFSLLIGIDGALFYVDCGLGVMEIAEPFFASGSGGPIALGSLHSTEGQPVRRRLELALEAAERFSNGVRRPWQFAESPARTT
jgi:ATP-dependent protease HslVU (ClpYQ) peptidase subunit